MPAIMPGGDPPATLARSACGRGTGHHTRDSPRRICSPEPALCSEKESGAASFCSGGVPAVDKALGREDT